MTIAEPETTTGTITTTELEEMFREEVACEIYDACDNAAAVRCRVTHKDGCLCRTVPACTPCRQKLTATCAAFLRQQPGAVLMCTQHSIISDFDWIPL